MNLIRFALVVSYDGATFDGWQTQPSGKAIQDYLEAALSKVASQQVAVVCSGRTDSGVHAIAQVVHADLPSNRPATAWVRGTNAMLPASIRVRSVHEVPTSFHARFSALERSYRYMLYQGPYLPPHLHQRVGWTFRDIDIAVMKACSQLLVGEHDFSSFRSSQCQAATPVRVITNIEFSTQGPLTIVKFSANAFLHHMIRNIMGALVEVGTHRKDLQWFQAMVAAKDRTKGAPTFSAHGLYFVGTRYPTDTTPDSLLRACSLDEAKEAQYWF
jgi:tRNA pseudouridine38-40 synthase